MANESNKMNNFYKSWGYCLSLVMLLINSSVNAQVRLPKLISDGMVLQRNDKVNVWGWASPKEEIKVTFNGHVYRTQARQDGKWIVKLNPLKAGGPYTLNIDASNHIRLANVYVGDVWFCSGQSNMQTNMGDVQEKYMQEIATANNPLIRQFTVPNATNPQQTDEDYTAGQWQPASPATIKWFSATAYFFAKALYSQYNIPLGIINASYGGTPIEAWISESGLKPFPEIYKSVLNFKDTAVVNKLNAIEKANRALENERTDAKYDLGANDASSWFSTSYNPTNWSFMLVPGYWADQGLKQLNGVVWYRKEIVLPASVSGKAGTLYLGRIVDADEAYVNGKLCGKSYHQYVRRNYAIPEGLLHEGVNSIVVRVKNTSGKGGFVPDKPYYIKVNSQIVDLSGKWLYRVGQVYTPQKMVSGSKSFQMQNQPSVLFNAMVAPALQYTVKGVTWYQGESNTGRAKEYARLLPALIKNWRFGWHNEKLPFLVAQLANYQEKDFLPAESQWAELREAQLSALSIPYTGIAVLIDAGEWNDIHSLDKKAVGDRLALQAQKMAYGETLVVASGPMYKSARVNGHQVIISFTDIGSGLMLKSRGLLNQFAIAGTDKKFVWADVKIVGNDVVVSSPSVVKPMFVRYAWANNPEGACLYNREGLPASPFRTDN